MKNKIKIGIIGCGTIFQIGYKPALKQIPEIEVVYLYDIERSIADREAAGFNAKSADSADDVFTDKEIILVLIATPPFARREYVMTACETKKHIIMEKPLASTLEDCEAIVEGVKKSGIKCWIPFWRYVHPIGKRITDLLADKETIGEPVSYYHTHIAPLYPWVKDKKNWIFDKRKNGGSLFYDFGIHFLEFALSIFGEPKKVEFNSCQLNKEINCDDNSSMFLEFEDQKTAVLNNSWVVNRAIQFEHHTNTIVTAKAIIHQPAFSTLTWRTPLGAYEYKPTSNDNIKSRIESIKEFIKCITIEQNSNGNIKDAYRAAMIYFKNQRK